MANTADYKEINGWGKQAYQVVLEYDFDNDAGAKGTLVMGKFLQKTLIRKGVVHCVAAGTSGGSATVVFGTVTGDPNGILDATDGAVANLTLGATVFTATTSDNLLVAANETLDMTIATDTLTAGKFWVILECYQVD